MDAMKILGKNRSYLINILCFSLQIVGYSVFYNGVQLSIERFGYSFGLGMTFVGIFECISYLTAAFIIHRLPRKNGILISVILTGLLGLCFAFSFVK